MELQTFVDRLRSGEAPKFPHDANTLDFAQKLDSQDSLRHLRDEFVIPTKASLKKKALDGRVPGMITPLTIVTYTPASQGLRLTPT